MTDRNRELVPDSWILVREGALTIAEEKEETLFSVCPISSSLNDLLMYKETHTFMTSRSFYSP